MFNGRHVMHLYFYNVLLFEVVVPMLRQELTRSKAFGNKLRDTASTSTFSPSTAAPFCKPRDQAQDLLPYTKIKPAQEQDVAQSDY